jgi:plasmid stabilization system protein ParE
MAHRIVWSRRAAQDLDSITDYIAAKLPEGTVVIAQFEDLKKAASGKD